MEMNFAFLEKKQEYELFSGACIDAERILESSPVMSAVASRKALELCVKWIYSIDSALEPIGNREGLQSLLHNNGFPSLMDITLWRRLQHIVRNGNESVHTKTAILEFDACFPDSVVGFIANERTNNIFVHYWFSFFQAILESQAPESAQKNINLKILSELKVIVPEKRKQDQFASFVKLTDKSKVAVRKY